MRVNVVGHERDNTDRVLVKDVRQNSPKGCHHYVSKTRNKNVIIIFSLHFYLYFSLDLPVVFLLNRKMVVLKGCGLRRRIVGFRIHFR